MGVPLCLAIRLLASGNLEQNPGAQRRRQLTGLVRHALSTRHLFAGPMVRASLITPEDLWSNPVAVADLLPTRRVILKAKRGPFSDKDRHGSIP